MSTLAVLIPRHSEIARFRRTARTFRSERGLEDHVEDQQHQQDGQDDQEQTVVGEWQPSDDAEAAVKDPWGSDVIEFGAEDELDDHLERETDTPGREQGLQWTIVDPLDDATLDDQPEKPNHREGHGDRDEGVAAKLADDGRSIRTHHDEFAVRHIDNAGHAENDRKTEGDENQDRDDAEPAQELGNDRLAHGRFVGLAGRKAAHVSRPLLARPAESVPAIRPASTI